MIKSSKSNQNKDFISRQTAERIKFYMSDNNITVSEVLQDKFPWQEKKAKTEVLANVYERLSKTNDLGLWVCKEYEKKSKRTRFCACWLSFAVTETKLVLKNACFCQLRLCPMCIARKSLKTFAQVSQIMDEVQRLHPTYQPVFLTLTIKNIDKYWLEHAIDHMTQSWYRLTKNRRFKDQVQGWVRTLEITYNHKTGQYHPHLHAILLMDKPYFSKDNARYMSTADWVQIWRTSARLDYDPICDIRAIKNNRKDRVKSVAEVAKYAVKDADFLQNDDVVHVLTQALAKKRLVATGGIMKKIQKELSISEIGEGDLVHINDRAIREDVATAIIDFGWSFGAGDYLRKR